jgi:hypothetical protein
MLKAFTIHIFVILLTLPHHLLTSPAPSIQNPPKVPHLEDNLESQVPKSTQSSTENLPSAPTELPNPIFHPKHDSHLKNDSPDVLSHQYLPSPTPKISAKVISYPNPTFENPESLTSASS